jgi:hypothetical protein
MPARFDPPQLLSDDDNNCGFWAASRAKKTGGLNAMVKASLD